MAKKKDLRFGAKGYELNKGWKASEYPDNGLWVVDRPVKTVQHRFYLGYDLNAAEVAALRLAQLWRQVEEEWASRSALTLDYGNAKQTDKPPRPLWEPLTLAMGMAVAKGAVTFSVPRRYASQRNLDYVVYLAHLRSKFTVTQLVAEDHEAFIQGQATAQRNAELMRRAASMVGRATGTGQMLHQALADYIEMLRGQERPGDSGWARTQANQAERLKKAHKDECLSNIGLTEMQRMFDYWRFRPKAETTNRPISPNTAGNHIWQLTDFFNWLHKEPKYEWRRPADCWIDIDKAIKLTTADKADRHQTLQVPTYSPEELAILYGYASPLMRAMILLALNCGFKQAELGTLRVSETFLNQAHPYAKMLGIPVNPNDSFIKRVRIKSGVYGEWLLWPETVQAIHWALDRRSQVKTNTPYLLVSSKGRGYADKTSAGNKPSMVRNYWESLLDTIQAEPNHEAFRRLPFSQLRKTGSDMVRAASDGEIAAVYECHGQPVRSDSLADIYTNRPFGKVFDALRKVRDRLEPMFADVPKVQIHQPTGT